MRLDRKVYGGACTSGSSTTESKPTKAEISAGAAGTVPKESRPRRSCACTADGEPSVSMLIGERDIVA